MKYSIDVLYKNLKDKKLVIEANTKEEAFIKLNYRKDINKIINIGSFESVLK